MPNKQLITVALSDLATSDVEGLGSVFERDNKLYKWVKNAGSTSLVASGNCLVRFTSVEASVGCRVISADGAAASTGLVTVPAGVPKTAIGPSGSTTTGDHGWILTRGLTTVRVMQSSAATGQNAGCIVMATSANPSTGVWDMGLLDTADSATTSYHYAKRLVLLNPILTTGPATFVTGVVSVQCAD